MEKHIIDSLDEFLGSRHLCETLETYLLSKQTSVKNVLHRGMNYPIHLIKVGNVVEEWHGSTHWSKDFQIAHNFAYDGYINEEFAGELQEELSEEIYKSYQVTEALDLFHPVIFRLKENTKGIDVHSIIEPIQELEKWKKEQEVTFIGVDFVIESFEYVDGEKPYYLIDVKELTADKCTWCKGSGIDSEGILLGNPYACTECRGTGFEHGEEGKKLYFKEMDRVEQRLIAQGLL